MISSGGMYGWGDPYDDDSTWMELKAGDRARVKPHVPVYGGWYGTLKSITDGDYQMEFEGGDTMTFDGDMLLKPKKV